MQILIVDDDFITRRLLRARLEQSGYNVQEANHGEEAWQILQQPNAPSLVITDWLMPVMDGLKLIECIREGLLDRYIYIIVLTNLDNPQDVVTGLEAGADDYIVKPFNILELQARLGIGKRILELEQRLRHLNTQLYEQATFDPLTQLYNRSTLLKRLDQHMRHALLIEKPLCLALCDLDHFKSINDTYGHAVGDEVLHWAAQLLQKTIRTNDDLGRWGGEEFLVVLPGASVEYAEVALERLRNTLASNTCQLTNGLDINITMSIGAVSTFLVPDLSLQHLLQRADQALYQAKHAGRNRLMCHEVLITSGDDVRLPQEM